VSYSAWYQCVRGCPGRYDVLDVIYRCPACDEAALAAAAGGAGWRALFDARRNPSGVWAKHEWVLPTVAPEHIVTLGEGNTPLLACPGLAADLGLDTLWVKQCGVSHTGSFKDLGMTVMVST